MIDYKYVKEVLNNTKNIIDSYLNYLDRNKDELEKEYKEIYYKQYKNNQYINVNGGKILLDINSFGLLYKEVKIFLMQQKNFIDQLLLLDYVKSEARLSKYTENLMNECILVMKQNYNFNTENMHDFYNILHRQNLMKDYAAILILEKFSKYDEDIVLIGGNGSGKTSFANQLKGNDTELIAVVPAQKNLYFSINDPNLLTTGLSDLVTLLFENNIWKGKADNFSYDFFNFQNNQFTRLILGMRSEFTSFLYECEREGKFPDSSKTIFGKVRKVFNALFPDIELRFEKEQANCLICLKKGNKYNINGLSEGEKVVLYYTISVFMAKEKSFIIVDEPETYINPSLTNALWDNLTKERSDCQFIFITHSIDFVLGRSNKKIAWIKSYTYPSQWEFEILENENELPQSMLTEILGSKKPIVFCEGNDKSSLDYHIYKAILQEDYTILPVNGHQQVISNCRALNKLNLNYKAWGIIDGDSISNERKQKYEEENIFVLPFNEIEMFLLEEQIMTDTIKSSYPLNYQEKINDFKDAFWKIFEKEKSKIGLSFVKTIIDEYIENFKINSVKTLDNIKEGLSDIIEINVDDIYAKKLEQLEQINLGRDYKKLLQVCNLKKEITKNIANKELDADYEEKAKQQIMFNDGLQQYLKSTYFSFLKNE